MPAVTYPPRANGNGIGAPRYELAPEPPTRTDLAIAAALVLASTTLVGLGIWKAAELVADAT